MINLVAVVQLMWATFFADRVKLFVGAGGDPGCSTTWRAVLANIMINVLWGTLVVCLLLAARGWWEVDDAGLRLVSLPGVYVMINEGALFILLGVWVGNHCFHMLWKQRAQYLQQRADRLEETRLELKELRQKVRDDESRRQLELEETRLELEELRQKVQTVEAQRRKTELQLEGHQKTSNDLEAQIQEEKARGLELQSMTEDLEARMQEERTRLEQQRMSIEDLEARIQEDRLRQMIIPDNYSAITASFDDYRRQLGRAPSEGERLDALNGMVLFALTRSPGSAVAPDRGELMAEILHQVCCTHSGQVQVKAVGWCGYLLHAEHRLGSPVRKRLLDSIMHCLSSGEGDVRLDAVRAVRSASRHLQRGEIDLVIKLFLEETRAETSWFRRYSDTQLVEAINLTFHTSLDTSCTREQVRDFLTSFQCGVLTSVREEVVSIVAGRVVDTVPAACSVQ